MDQRQHAFVPQWYRGEASRSSSQSDGRNNGVSLSRLPTSDADRSHGLHRTSSSSSLRSASGNGGDCRDINFGGIRRYRDSNRGRYYPLENEDDERFDPIRRDLPRRSRSGVATRNGVGIGVASFESEFPSLGTQISSGSQTAASVVSSTGTGLSMAERLVRAQQRVQTAEPQMKDDSETKKELLHFRKLIPTVNKHQVHSFEKSKSKVSKSCERSAPKRIAPQSSSQPACRARHLRVETTSKIASREAARNPHPSTTVNHNPKSNGKAGERKPLSKSQSRIDFFKGLRKMDLDANSVESSSSTSECSVAENGSNGARYEDFYVLTPPDEEEAALLRSLEWDENAEVEPLTKEEIESFRLKHPKVLQRDARS